MGGGGFPRGTSLGWVPSEQVYKSEHVQGSSVWEGSGTGLGPKGLVIPHVIGHMGPSLPPHTPVSPRTDRQTDRHY